MIHIDFESRSEADIYAVGAWAYSVHPSTEILCFAFAEDDGPIEYVSRPDILAIEDGDGEPFMCDEGMARRCFAIMDFAKQGQIFMAHNAFFEQSMYTNICVKKWGWPRIPIKNWRCSQAKGLAYAYPAKLEKLAEAIQSQHKKDKAGYQVMLKMCKPNGKGEWYEDPQDFEKLYQYCCDDVAAEREIDKLLPDLIPQEQTYWFLDQLINQRGITIDTVAVEKALGFIEQYTTNLNNIIYEQSGMQLDRVTRRQAVLDWCKSQGVDVPGYTKSDVKQVLEQEGLPESVRTVLETKLELGKTSVAKYQALANSVSPDDGRIRDTLIYHGATTGRWTGKLFQLQNLPRGSVKDVDSAITMLKKEDLGCFEMFYPDVMGTLSSCIRGMIIASEGCELYVGDYNAIEARVLFWLHGEAYGLKQYTQGTDIYVDMAKRIYNVDTVSKSQRELGKRAVLGCGYGMGAVKFAATCAAQGQAIPDGLAKRAVDAYRNTYTSVVAGWYAQESSAINTLTTKQDSVCGRIRWKMDSRGTLLCQLPSDRCLSYPRAFLEYTDTPWGERKLTIHYYAVDSKTKRWGVERTYGGKITENITQAIARDILASAMFRVEQRGYPVIFSVHDEIVCEVPVREGTHSLESWKQLLVELPQWASGCPIKAECWKGKRYRK